MSALRNKNYAYVALIAGISIITAVWGFELYEDSKTLAQVSSTLILTLTALLAIMFLGLSFSLLIRLPHDKKLTKAPRRSIIWIFIIFEAVILLTASYLTNSLTLVLMPLIFLTLALYPVIRYASSLSHYFLGLCFSIVPIYIWAAIWGKFHTISSEFTFQPVILGIITLFWASSINIRHTFNDDENSKIRRTFTSTFGLSTAKFAINFNVSIILGLLFFLTVINGHTFVLWLGLVLTVILALILTEKQRKADAKSDYSGFDKLSSLIILTFMLFQVVDVAIEVFFLPN